MVPDKELQIKQLKISLGMKTFLWRKFKEKTIKMKELQLMK